MVTPEPKTDRLETLLGFLQVDPNNPSLLSTAAQVALDENHADIARSLLTRYAAHSPLPPHEANLSGLVALRLEDFATAAHVFGELYKSNSEDHALQSNLAWALTMLRDYQAALDVLSDEAVQSLPQAAMLKIQLMHETGLFDEAVSIARDLLSRHPTHPGLQAAVSVLALDVDDPELARACAQRGGDHPDALATLGALALSDARNVEALRHYERALQKNPRSPRALVGKGLSLLLTGAYADAARFIEEGAHVFHSHTGSWIAAGWARLFESDLASAKVNFSRALELDRSFSEAHGSLAVVRFAEGDIEEARRLTQTALRLDANSFSGALARALLLSNASRPEAARALIDRALHTPIDAEGRTIAQSLAQFGFLS